MQKKENHNGKIGRLRALLHAVKIPSCLYIIAAYIASFILVTEFTVQRFEPSDFSYQEDTSQSGYITEGEKGIFSYGPDMSIDRGYYKVKVKYESDQHPRVDIVYSESDTGEAVELAAADLSADSKSAWIRFRTDKIDNDSFEIRTYYPGEGSFRLVGVELGRVFRFSWNIVLALVLTIVVYWWGKYGSFAPVKRIFKKRNSVGDVTRGSNLAEDTSTGDSAEGSDSAESTLERNFTEGDNVAEDAQAGAILAGKSHVRNIAEKLYIHIFYIFETIYLLYEIKAFHESNDAYREYKVYILLFALVILHGVGLKYKVYEKLEKNKVLGFCSYLGVIISMMIPEWVLRTYVGKKILFTKEITDIIDAFDSIYILCFVLVLSLIPWRKVRRAVYGIVYAVCSIILFANMLFYTQFGKLISFRDLGFSKEGADYTGYVLTLISGKVVGILVLLIGVGILNVWLLKYMPRLYLPVYGGIAVTVVSLIMYCSGLYTEEFGEWNSFQNDSYQYAAMVNRDKVYSLCGFYQYEWKDVVHAFQLDNKDFSRELEQVERYYDALPQEDTENEYSGYYADKNVIFVLMESVDDFVLREDLMPNLYRMAEEGITFTNMYASIFGAAATMNAEFVTNVGLYAPRNGAMLYSFAENDFPYSIAARMSDKGYACRQYHYNSPDYYDRGFMNQAFGYQEYVCYADYREKDIQNDIALYYFDELYYTLIQDERFFDYVITYSGHLPYYRENDALAGFSYGMHPELQYYTDSLELNNYLAKIRLTDDMLGGLLDRLEEDGVLENTVIVCAGDHYAYGLRDTGRLHELSGSLGYTQLLYKVPFLIWTPGGVQMEVDKVCSSIDIVPTLVNLLGLGDTSMYMGNDILSDSYDGVAYFEDGSWINDRVFCVDGEAVIGSMPAEEMEEMQEKLFEKMTINDSILLSDYYRYHAAGE